jgi:hypothetical protein
LKAEDAERFANLPELKEDLSKTFLKAALKSGTVAWDIETSGLDWRSERIALPGFGEGARAKHSKN